MSKNAVRQDHGALPPEGGHAVLTGSRRASVDAIRVLSEAVQRPGSALRRLPGTPAQRPFDAQYWACWVFAVTFPLLMTYLWIAG